MPRRQTYTDCNHLLNFKQNLSPNLQSSATASTSKSSSNYSRRRKTSYHDPKKEASERAEKWTRDNLNSSFYLHSSASHAFIVTRSKVDKQKGDSRPRFLRVQPGKNKSNDADSVVDWDAVKIVKVQVPTSSSLRKSNHQTMGPDYENDAISTCSICLSSLVAPRITTCGHVYCYPCILRHFHVGNNDSKGGVKSRFQDSIVKCPCCFTYIQLSDMRPVQFITVQSPTCNSGSNNNVTMTFQKCHRKRSGMVPFLPIDLFRNDENREANQVLIRKRIDPNDLPDVDDHDAPYCRFNYLDIAKYIQHLQNDLSSLQYEMQSVADMIQNFKGNGTAIGDLDLFFVTMAIEAVQTEYSLASSCVENQTNLKAEQEAQYSTLSAIKVVPYLHDCLETSKEDSIKNEEKLTMMSPTRVQQEWGNDDHDNLKKSKRRPRVDSIHLQPGTTYLDNDCVQFYQAKDGQLCFLCSFNIRCLSYEFLDREDEMDMQSQYYSRPPFPDVVKGQVIDVQTVHLTPEARNKMSFTTHLPLYIDITLVELNLSQYLSQATRDHFRNEFDQRKKKRQAHRNAEKKAKKLAELAENERIENLKKRLETVGINDYECFDSRRHDVEEVEDFVGEHFGPSLSSSPRQSTHSSTKYPQSIHRSYGSVCASNGYFPTLNASDNEVFPSLSESATVSTQSKCKENDDIIKPDIPQSHVTPIMPKSEKKSKVVLLSTGGRRSYGK